MLTISQAILDAIVAHARRDHPDEACGVVAGVEGSDNPTRHIPMENAARSMTFYEFDSTEYLRVWREMDDRDEEAVLIYHSHTATEAYPSRSDVAYAGWPQAHYLLVSTREPDRTEIRSFRIVDGVVTEEPVRVVDALGPPVGAAQRSPTPIPARPRPTRADPEQARSSGPNQEPTVDPHAVQSYLFGQTPAMVDYECRSGS